MYTKFITYHLLGLVWYRDPKIAQIAWPYVYIEGQVCQNRDGSFEKSTVDLEVKMGVVHLVEHFFHLGMLLAKIVSMLHQQIPILDSIMIYKNIEINILQYDKTKWNVIFRNTGTIFLFQISKIGDNYFLTSLTVN